MLNFRQFELTDPFGRAWQVLFKWMQTAISLRHSDTVDVKFVLRTGEQKLEKVMAMLHTDLLRLSKDAQHPLTDAWCSRLAAMHLKHVVETAEDLEKDLITVPYADLERYAREIAREEQAEVERRKGAA